jgi:hypothetical protein
MKEKVIKEARIIGSDSTYWIFQFKNKKKPSQNLIKKFSNKIFESNHWYMTIPVYRTKKEATKALKNEINRIKKHSPSIKIIIKEQ